MNFVKNKKADESLDLFCRACPLRLLGSGDKIRCLKEGKVLEILPDYDGALNDIPGFCEKFCHEVIGLDEYVDCYKLYLRK